MKYPFVLFYRVDGYSNIDNFFIENKNILDCTVFIVNDIHQLNLLHNKNYQLLITYGEDSNVQQQQQQPQQQQQQQPQPQPQHTNRHIHIHENEIVSVGNFNQLVNRKFISICALDRELVRPIFSIFTTTYNSYHKIIRAYHSILNQKFCDWEWIIIDDSPTDEHFAFLKNVLKDARIRLYKRSENSGNIGNVKNEAISLCRGKYVLEMDHDDEILTDTLYDAVTYFDAHEDVGFIYMDFINIYENGNNFNYGNYICKGYGSYYCQKYKEKWVYVYNTPNINNITLSHLVCCPNHPRIWRKDVLMKAGNYSEYLPICDDYEILLRTALITKMAKISKFAYVQYMNDSNNNFSLIRNGEINRIGPHFIQPIFYDTFKINDYMKTQNAYEDETYICNHSQIWKRDESYQHKYCNHLVNVDYDMQYCILGIDALNSNIEKIRELYQNPRNDFILLDQCNIETVCNVLDDYEFSRFKCYAMNADMKELEKYFIQMYLSCKNYHIFTSFSNYDQYKIKQIKKIQYNTDMNNRYTVINMLTNVNDRYLEIGIEYGINFENVHFTKKEGVDPDPKCYAVDTIAKKIHVQTSDEYFSEKDVDEKDVIFIDGMHQSEYVLRDINNSIRILSYGGKLFMDDIIPSSYYEQLKIPRKHYYEKGILKYGEPWTGDVWKVLYYMLIHFSDSFDLSYYHHPNYRGIAFIQIKDKFEIEYSAAIDIINAYEYNTDFDDYIDILIAKSLI
jgi:glycosyltransferase involved in cell wall biosynthesis